ncbi:MAG: prenyltransferase [Halodesulfurarchaeum sp.]
MLRYLLALSRPRFWLYLAGPVLVGLAFGATSTSALFGLESIALLAYFLVPANVYLYGINDVFDADVDRKNPKKEDKEVRYRGQSTVIVVIVASGILLLPVAWLLLPTARWWLLGWFLLATAYSVPPVRFKSTPVLDSVSNGLYVLPGVAAYAALSGTQPPPIAVVGGWTWSMAMHTFSAIPDIGPDRAAGIRTTATLLGRRNAYWYCAVLWTAAATLFWVLDWRLGLLLAVYPVLVGLISNSDVAVDRAYWWYPAINSIVGAAFTLGGLWRLLYG